VKFLVLKSESGKVTWEQLIDGDLKSTITTVARKALDEWDVDKLDFIILKDVHEVRKKLPLSPSVYEMISIYLKGKEGGEAFAEVPVYIISFDNQWEEDDFKDKRIYVLTPYLDDESKKEMVQYATELTSEEVNESEE